MLGRLFFFLSEEHFFPLDLCKFKESSPTHHCHRLLGKERRLRLQALFLRLVSHSRCSNDVRCQKLLFEWTEINCSKDFKWYVVIKNALYSSLYLKILFSVYYCLWYDVQSKCKVTVSLFSHPLPNPGHQFLSLKHARLIVWYSLKSLDIFSPFIFRLNLDNLPRLVLNLGLCCLHFLIYRYWTHMPPNQDYLMFFVQLKCY